MNNLNIIIAGLGNVGSELINYFENNKNFLENKIKRNIFIKGICALNREKKRSFSIKPYDWYDSPIEMINNTKPDVFIELIGHEKGISYDSIKLSIEKEIDIITANKALIANYGDELFKLADKSNVRILYEASVAGGIPVIKTIKESLIGNKIKKLSGILNGTTNYILTNMTNNKVNFKNALEDAKNKGYVELNPDLDIEGIDSAHKLSILSSLAFKTKFAKFNNIYRQGISNIDDIDINFANQLKFVIKLLSVVEMKENKLIQYVKPVMINKQSQLAKVSGVLNGIQISTNDIGTIFLEGEGAGGKATVSSIISDISEICYKKFTPTLGVDYNSLDYIENFPTEELEGFFYIRIIVEDKKGVLANITSILKDENISIETLIQNPLNQKIIDDLVPIVILTHKTYIKNLINSIKKINTLSIINNNAVVIQIDKV